MTDDSPAFPSVEVTRHITQPGMTTREYAVIHFIAAMLQANPSLDSEKLVRAARDLADLALPSGS